MKLSEDCSKDGTDYINASFIVSEPYSQVGEGEGWGKEGGEGGGKGGREGGRESLPFLAHLGR